VKDTWSGLKLCEGDTSYCNASYPNNVTALGKGKVAQLTFNAQSTTSGLPQRLNVTFELVYTPDPDAPHDNQLVSFGLYDLVPEVR